MTIFFPDISSYEDGLTIAPGTVAVIAKATEGTYYRDANYAGFKAQAAAVGAVLSAYHFLKAGNGAGQAEYCHAMVGSTPVMLDVEPEGASNPTVADCAAFIARMRQLGGRVWGVYYPRWYWSQTGGDLASLGVALIASGYPGGYSDTDPNWNAYGGKAPDIWQYTDKQSYGGMSVDFNAYRGTVAQLAALINGTTPTTGDEMDLTPENLAAIAAAVNSYRDTNNEIQVNGKPYAASAYELAVGTWKAVNDPAGGLEQARWQVNNLFHRPVFDAGAFAAAVTPVIQAAVAAGLPADEIAQKIAEAVPGHIELTVSAK